MKDFQKATRGMAKGSAEYNGVRNDIYKRLKQEQAMI